METLIYGGPMFIGDSDHLKVGWAVLITDGLITAVGPVEELSARAPQATRLDVGQRTILPGLIDAHRHLIGPSAAEITPELIASGAILGVRVAQDTLTAGITTVRDPGCKHDAIFELRRAIHAGLVPGPAIYAAGRNPTGQAAPRTWRNHYVRGPWEMRQAVRELARDGADWIKLVASHTTPASGWKFCQRYLTDEEIQAAVDETHALGMRISAHTEGLEAARSLVNAGADAIEHGTVLDDDLVRRMADLGTFLVPTLWLYTHDYDPATTTPDQLEAYRAFEAEHSRGFQRALQAGVSIAVGTDAITDLPLADCLVIELELMHAHGMNTPAALRAATVGGAGVLGQADRLGRLAPGYLADVIAINGDPLKDLRALTQVDLVIQRGQICISKLAPTSTMGS